MQYLLMIYANESGWSTMSKAEQEQGMAAYLAFGEALSKAGTLGGLESPSAGFDGHDRSRRHGKTQVLDGPFVDSKEQFGGYYLIDVPDLDSALSWAALPGQATAPSRCVRSGVTNEQGRAHSRNGDGQAHEMADAVALGATGSSSLFSRHEPATWRPPKTHFPRRSCRP